MKNLTAKKFFTENLSDISTRGAVAVTGAGYGHGAISNNPYTENNHNYRPHKRPQSIAPGSVSALRQVSPNRQANSLSPGRGSGEPAPPGGAQVQQGEVVAINSEAATELSIEEDADTMAAQYERFTNALVGRYGRAEYDSCLGDMTVAKASAELVTFETASPARRDMIGRHYLASIKQLWLENVGPVKRVAIKLRPEVSKSLKDSAARAKTKEPSTGFFKDISGQFSGAPAPHHRPGVPGYSQAPSSGSQWQGVPWVSLKDLLSPVDVRNSFENFAVDASNGVAFAAARKAVSGSAPAELIYLYGKSGVGKTHLLHAISQERARLDDIRPVAYLAYNNIASGCVSAMLTNNVSALHREFLNCSIVLIDDIHLLISKGKTQQQVLSIIDACLSSGVHVAVAGEPAPVRLAEAGMHQRLADRLSGGFCVPLLQGGPHLRLEVLKKYLAWVDIKCSVTEEVLEFIVRNFTHSMRGTIGALKQLLLVYGERDMRVDLSLAKTSLRALLQDGARVYTLDDLLTVSAEVMGVSVADMKGRARPQPIARARHAFVYCAREDLKKSLPAISAALCRDHTTALSSARRAAALLEKDKLFCRQIEQIREKIEL